MTSRLRKGETKAADADAPSARKRKREDSDGEHSDKASAAKKPRVEEPAPSAGDAPPAATPTYEIEAVVGERETKRNGVQFKIRWRCVAAGHCVSASLTRAVAARRRGCPPSDDSWEPAANIDAQGFIDEFRKVRLLSLMASIDHRALCVL